MLCTYCTPEGEHVGKVLSSLGSVDADSLSGCWQASDTAPTPRGYLYLPVAYRGFPLCPSATPSTLGTWHRRYL